MCIRDRFTISCSFLPHIEDDSSNLSPLHRSPKWPPYSICHSVARSALTTVCPPSSIMRFWGWAYPFIMIQDPRKSKVWLSIKFNGHFSFYPVWSFVQWLESRWLTNLLSRLYITLLYLFSIMLKVHIFQLTKLYIHSVNSFSVICATCRLILSRRAGFLASPYCSKHISLHSCLFIIIFLLVYVSSSVCLLRRFRYAG